MLFTSIKFYCQSGGMIEIGYTKPFLDSQKLGEMTAPNIFEIGLGWKGSAMIPYGGVTLGYIGMDDKTNNGLPNPSSYQSLMIGGRLGIRPLANVWVSRFQPLIQIGGKTTFKITTENKTTKESEQLFSNGNTKVYEPAKISFYSGSVGFEFYLGKRFSIDFLGNYDYVIIEESKFNNYSATVGLRQYF